MSRTIRCILLAGLASGCGPTMEEYDERTVELHRAEDHLARSLVSEKQSEKQFVDMSAELAKEKDHGRVLEAELNGIGVKSAADLIGIKLLMTENQRRSAEVATRKAEREQLQAGLIEEVEAGVVRFEERDGMLRIVMPEEALFAPGASRLSLPAKKIVESVARELSKLPTRRLLVTGHTDIKMRTVGWAVSLERARQVLEFLVAKGVEPGRIAAAGYAEYDPIADTTTDDGRARNRRVEIQLLARNDYVPVGPPPALVAKVPPPPASVANFPLVGKVTPGKPLPVGVSPPPLSVPLGNMLDDPGLGSPPPPQAPVAKTAPPAPVRAPVPPPAPRPVAKPAPTLDDPGL